MSVVIVLSHGEKDFIYGCDGGKVSISLTFYDILLHSVILDREYCTVRQLIWRPEPIL